MSAFHDAHYHTQEFKDFMAAVIDTEKVDPHIVMRMMYAMITRARSNPKLSPRQVFLFALADAVHSCMLTGGVEQIKMDLDLPNSAGFLTDAGGMNP